MTATTENQLAYICVLETPDRNPCRKNNFTSPKEEFNDLRLKNPNRLICAHLNINSVRNKFYLLSDIIKNNIDILMISEKKLDSSFLMDSFKFMAIRNLIDLMEMEMVVEYLYLSAKIYQQN